MGELKNDGVYTLPLIQILKRDKLLEIDFHRK